MNIERLKRLGFQIALFYDTQPIHLGGMEMVSAYRDFSTQICEEYRVLVRFGYQFEPWNRVGQPYSETDSSEMFADLQNNKHLFYFKTENGQPVHSLLTPEVNDKFRCVHDVLGHFEANAGFDFIGECRAFANHAQTMLINARRALATETLGQNCWLNFIGHRYADQKAILLPDEFIDAVYNEVLS